MEELGTGALPRLEVCKAFFAVRMEHRSAESSHETWTLAEALSSGLPRRIARVIARRPTAPSRAAGVHVCVRVPRTVLVPVILERVRNSSCDLGAASLFGERRCECPSSSACCARLTFSIHASVMSIPAETPELVQIFPAGSSTHLARFTQSTFGPCVLTHSNDFSVIGSQVRYYLVKRRELAHCSRWPSSRRADQSWRGSPNLCRQS